MSLSPRSSRRRGGAVVRARQNVETLEHQTQANVLLAFKLSMVSGNGVSQVPTRPSYRTYRKMSDIGVQYDPPCDSSEPLESPVVNSTVAEINTSAELDTPNSVDHQPPIYHRPVSVESSGSSSSNASSSGEERERKKLVKNEQVDMDAIHVQQSTVDEVDKVEEKSPKMEKFEIDEGEKKMEESSCCLDCLSFSLQCCDCTIS